ncbi:MAG TPA: LysE family translocator [Thermoleophilaceae bacterium]|nr:LysE family translocator [Thermoleophilaceae bacterium]
MPAPETMALFALASLALIVFPGPSVLYILARSFEGGRRAGLVSMLGVEAGGLVHVAAATLGLSALLASSAVAFGLVKYAGAAYLVWLGFSRLRSREAPELPPAPHGRLFRQGVFVNVLNPKTALFFLAFLPQFVDPGAGSASLQAAVLGLVFVGIAVVSDGLYALVGGSVAERIRRSPAVRRRLDRASGAVLIGLGAVAALTGSRRAV